MKNRELPISVWHNQLQKAVKVLNKEYTFGFDEQSVVYTIELEDGSIEKLERSNAGLEYYYVHRDSETGLYSSKKIL